MVTFNPVSSLRPDCDFSGFQVDFRSVCLLNMMRQIPSPQAFTSAVKVASQPGMAQQGVRLTGGWLLSSQWMAGIDPYYLACFVETSKIQ